MPPHGQKLKDERDNAVVRTPSSTPPEVETSSLSPSIMMSRANVKNTTNGVTSVVVPRHLEESSDNESDQDCCIAIPPFLQQLIGMQVSKNVIVDNDVDFGVVNDASTATATATATTTRESVAQQEQSPQEQLPPPEQEDSIPVMKTLVVPELLLQPPKDALVLDTSVEPKKKPRKSPFGRLKSKVKKRTSRRGPHASNTGVDRLSSCSSQSDPPSLVLTVPSKKAQEAEEELDQSLTTTISSSDAVPTNSQEDWIQSHYRKMDQYKQLLDSVMSQTREVSQRAHEVSARLVSTQGQVYDLECALTKAMQSLQQDQTVLQATNQDLVQLQQEQEQIQLDLQTTQAAVDNFVLVTTATPTSCRTPPPPLRGRCTSLPSQLEQTPRITNETTASSLRKAGFQRTSSFMRIHDLDLEDTSSLVSTASSVSMEHGPEKLFFLDHDVKAVLEALSKMGHETVTDESDRFKPVRDTEKILKKRNSSSNNWQEARDKEILVWSGLVQKDGFFGSNIPVLKARGIIPATPRQVLDLILDSSRVQEYNKMSLGRADVVVLQKGVDTLASESPFGINGEVRITKSLNKPPFIRRNIEMLSLLYAKALSNGCYLMTSRSVWEEEEPSHLGSKKNTMRSEMLLGVNYLRALPNDATEMTTITHVFSPGVPEMLAKSFAPTAAANFIKDMQALFS